MKSMSDDRIKKIREIVDVINGYLDSKIKELPYNINVIDELHANENAHSRILCKLLRYRDSNGKYKILEDLLQYVSQFEGKEEFKKIKLSNPTITQEVERIDLWVRDEDYAIIFENKVRGAIDQNSQLSRYIARTQEAGYEDNKIYVIYLPADEHEPSDNSWGENKGKFKKRYINLSFRKHILPWLKESVLPNCIIKEELLISAIRQYIDHLEGLFWMRPSQKKIIMDKKVLEKIGLNKGSFAEQYEEFKKILKDIQRVENSLSQILQNESNELIENIKRKIGNLFEEECGINHNISQNAGWLFVYKKKWKKTSSFVHLEWSGMSFESLFSQKEYKFVLHLEGGWNSDKKDFSKNLINECNKETEIIKKGAKKSSTTFYTHTFRTEKPLAMMKDDELHKFFNDVYNHKEVKVIIAAIDKLNEEIANPSEPNTLQI